MQTQAKIEAPRNFEREGRKHNARAEKVNAVVRVVEKNTIALGLSLTDAESLICLIKALREQTSDGWIKLFKGAKQLAPGPDSKVAVIAHFETLLGRISSGGHTKDSDCTVVNGECVVCHVDHSGKCESCGGHGFHKAGCTHSDERVTL